MTPREVIIGNIECGDADRIGFSFTGAEERRNDFTGAGCNHGIEIERWEEGEFEYYSDIWGNVWYRLTSLSKGGEVHRAVLESWSDLDRLELPDLDNPAYYEGARRLGAYRKRDRTIGGDVSRRLYRQELRRSARDRGGAGVGSVGVRHVRAGRV